jgi:hypothetical protein
VIRPPDAPEDEPRTHSFTRELGLTHAEFHRSLPPAIAHRPYAVDGDRVRIDDGARSVTIELGPQRYRAIASLRIPYLEARFTFSGFSVPERDAFMTRFERYFQRGGG